MKYTCSYRVGSREFVFHIEADNAADAQNHMLAIRNTAQVDGELISEASLSLYDECEQTQRPN